MVALGLMALRFRMDLTHLSDLVSYIAFAIRSNARITEIWNMQPPKGADQLSESVLDVMYADLGSVGEDPDHVEAQGVEGWFSGVEVVFGYGAQGVLLAVGDGFQGVSVAGSAPQLDFHEDKDVVLVYYQVDLPAPCSVVALEKCVTVLDQVAQREIFAPGPGGSILQSPTPA
jgi:hypothetical protein